MSVKLAHFELHEQIGRGGMATVFRAFDPSLNRSVAIKLLNEDLAQEGPQFVENFLREAQHAAAISHPNIVQIYFIGEADGNYYLVMELLEGQTLENLLDRNGPLDEATALKIAAQVTAALQAAYVNELVHGDIKPANIYITKSGDVKLLDFGLAKLANVEVQVENDGRIWGSPYYISPERVGTKAEDFRSDIYSLGATLFHALSGRPPFDDESPGELAVKRLREKAPAVRSFKPEVSAATEKIVAQMLEKNAYLRYLDYDSLLADLRKTAEKSGSRSAGTVTTRVEGVDLDQLAKITKLVNTLTVPVQVPQPEKKSLLPLILAGSAALLVIGGGIAFFATRNKTAPPATVHSTPSPSLSPSPTPDEQTVREDKIRPGETITFDTVEPGGRSEAGHKFASDRSETGDFRGRKWRDALPGGWFSYEMAVDPKKPVALVSTYWSDDRGRKFELQIDGRTLAIARPCSSLRNEFYETAYAIPPEMTRGKKSVTVRIVNTHSDRVGILGLGIKRAAAITAEQWAPIDTIEPNGPSEIEHKLASDRSQAGSYGGGNWRDTLPGGWFSYEMAVDPKKPVALVSTYLNTDYGRQFELQIDGRTIAIASPNPSGRPKIYEAAYAIPPEMTRGKKSVTVRVVNTHTDRVGTYGLRIVRANAVTAEQWAAGQK